MDRREFINGVGGAVLTVQCLPLIGCSSGADDESDEYLIIRSGPGFVPHTHDLLIPYAVLDAPPPEGVKLVSSRAMFHTHDVALTREQLVTVNQGGIVTAIGGSHRFVIALSPVS